MIRLFVGTSGNNEDLEAEMVLEYTARKHCSQPLEITFMRQAKAGPWSGWASSKNNRTPFTSFRWSLPAVCEFKGRAIYSDVDFLYTGDLAEVWAQNIPHVALVRNPTGKLSTSFIVFDCEKAKGHVPSLDALRKMPDAHSTVLNYFRTHPDLLAATKGNWDCADLKGTTLDHSLLKAVHYTRIEHQLHLKYAMPRLKKEGRSHWYTGPVFTHPNSALIARFDQEYQDALKAGYSLEQYRVTNGVQSDRKDFTYKHHIGAARA